MKAELVRDTLQLIAHFAGRLRVRAETFRVLPEVGDEVVGELLAQQGVTAASASPVTGSILVTYDAAVVQLPRLVAVIVRTGGLHGISLATPAGWDERPSGGSRVRSKLAALNGQLQRKTRGAVDLKVAVPAALTGTGLLMLLAGRRRVPEWYDLLFWGFVTFSNLNPPATSPATPRAANDDATGLD